MGSAYPHGIKVRLALGWVRAGQSLSAPRKTGQGKRSRFWSSRSRRQCDPSLMGSTTTTRFPLDTRRRSSLRRLWAYTMPASTSPVERWKHGRSPMDGVGDIPPSRRSTPMGSMEDQGPADVEARPCVRQLWGPSNRVLDSVSWHAGHPFPSQPTRAIHRLSDSSMQGPEVDSSVMWPLPRPSMRPRNPRD